MTVLSFLFALLIWPGVLGGSLYAWLLLWFQRKLAARLQGRKGPPFYQPFFDFVKLAGKEAVLPATVSRRMLYALPIISLIAVVSALALILAPANPRPSFSGDMILLLYFLEAPVLCEVLAGFISRSPYAQVGASREAILSLGYNLPLLAAVISLAVRAKSLTIAAIAGLPLGPVHAAAAVTFLLALPACLKRNPFSIPNAEQEIVAGPLTEFSGVPLAIFELAHGLELIALVSLFFVLFIPVSSSVMMRFVAYVLTCFAVVSAATAVAVGTARVTVRQAFRFYWSWGAAAAGVSLLAAIW